jgi:hypothetical protein
MFAQTFGDLAVLRERRLIESFAFPIENKSFAQLLDSKRPGNWFSGLFPMGHDGRQKLKAKRASVYRDRQSSNFQPVISVPLSRV